MLYKNEAELLEIVQGFEAATIKEVDWHHAEHVIVACRYARDYPIDEAIERMRNGIRALLIAFKVDTTSQSPYHETLTVFWMRAVRHLMAENPGLSFFDHCEFAVGSFDKDYPFEFYSREHLFSDEARRNFVEADLRPLNFR